MATDPLYPGTKPNAQIAHSWRDGGTEWVRLKLMDSADEAVVPMFAVNHDGRNSWFYRPGKHVWVHPDALKFPWSVALPT